MATRLKAEEIRLRMASSSSDPNFVGDNELVAAPGVGRKIICYGYRVWNNVDTAQTVRFRSATNDRSPAIVMGVSAAAKTMYGVGPSEFPVFECFENEALNLNLAAATAVGCTVWTRVERV